jgi:hypothetical protein
LGTGEVLEEESSRQAALLQDTEYGSGLLGSPCRMGQVPGTARSR